MGKISNFLILVRYLFVVLSHKLAIIRAGLWVNRQLRGTGYRVSWWRLLKHDFSKFGCHELWPYAEFFNARRPGFKKEDPNHPRDKEAIERRNAAFKQAWKHHYLHNDHHPEHFVTVLKEKDESGCTIEEMRNNAKRMPEAAVLEMVADSFGASLGYEGVWPKSGSWIWVTTERLNKLPMRRPSFLTFCAVLCALGFSKDVSEVFSWNDIQQCNEFTPEEQARLMRLKERAERNIAREAKKTK